MALPSKDATFEVVAEAAEVRAVADTKSALVAKLPRGTIVKVELTQGNRAMLNQPTFGWVSIQAADGSPILARPNSKRKPSDRKKQPSLAEFAWLLKKNLDIRDRSYHFKTYKDCFVGKEAITWMVAMRHARTRKQALDTLNKLHRLGVVKHVLNQHNVKDAYLFYRIVDEKIPGRTISSSRRDSKSREAQKEKQRKQLDALTTRKDQEMRKGAYGSAAKLQAQIDALKEQMSMSSQSSQSNGFGGLAATNERATPQFSPTDFFSVSPELNKTPMAPSNVAVSSKLEAVSTGARIEISGVGVGTVVRKKGPNRWYILYDDGRCEIQKLSGAQYRVLEPARCQVPDWSPNDPTKLDTKGSGMASVTSSLHEFSLGEQDLGRSPSSKADTRERSGRFDNTLSFLESRTFSKADSNAGSFMECKNNLSEIQASENQASLSTAAHMSTVPSIPKKLPSMPSITTDMTPLPTVTSNASNRNSDGGFSSLPEMSSMPGAAPRRSDSNASGPRDEIPAVPRGPGLVSHQNGIKSPVNVPNTSLTEPFKLGANESFLVGGMQSSIDSPKLSGIPDMGLAGLAGFAMGGEVKSNNPRGVGFTNSLDSAPGHATALQQQFSRLTALQNVNMQ